MVGSGRCVWELVGEARRAFVSSVGLVAVVPPNGAFEQSGGRHEAEPSSPSPSAPARGRARVPGRVAGPRRQVRRGPRPLRGAARYETHPRQRASPPARARSTASTPGRSDDGVQIPPGTARQQAYGKGRLLLDWRSGAVGRRENGIALRRSCQQRLNTRQCQRPGHRA